MCFKADLSPHSLCKSEQLMPLHVGLEEEKKDNFLPIFEQAQEHRKETEQRVVVSKSAKKRMKKQAKKLAEKAKESVFVEQPVIQEKKELDPTRFYYKAEVHNLREKAVLCIPARLLPPNLLEKLFKVSSEKAPISKILPNISHSTFGISLSPSNGITNWEIGN